MTSSNNDSYSTNYQVRVTKSAIRQGNKLSITPSDKMKVIKEMKLLKYWDQNKDNFEYQNAFGAIEFKYRLQDKWLRVFAYKDDYNKTMWIIYVYFKKDNQINRPAQLGIEAAVKKIEVEVEKIKKFNKKSEKSGSFNVIKGGRSE